MRARVTLLCCLWTSGFVCASTKSLPLPSYIIPCSRNEPDLNACSLKRGRETIPNVIDGDRKYKIPVLDPLEISYIKVDEGVLGLNFSATDVKLHGLRNTTLDYVRWDTEKKEGEYQLSFPRLEVEAHYMIDGRILILPITGDGRANLTFNDVTVNYTFTYDIVERENGQSFLLPLQSKLAFDTSRMYAHLYNLFNGNKLLGDQMNAFIDENWREVKKELGPFLGDTIAEVMRRIQFNIFELVDYDTAFPDTHM